MSSKMGKISEEAKKGGTFLFLFVFSHKEKLLHLCDECKLQIDNGIGNYCFIQSLIICFISFDILPAVAHFLEANYLFPALSWA